MLGKSPDQTHPQSHLFRPLLKDFIDLKHPLVVLSQKLDWKALEADFEQYYSHTGLPSLPVRMMSGALILKQMFNLSDERMVDDWVQNPYYQYFTGSIYFSWEKPFDPSELVHFRKRINEEGTVRIFQMSVDLHKSAIAKCNEVIIDTTVQEKNITFPTDTKLALKIIDKCHQIAKNEAIKLRQNYKRVLKKEKVKIRFSTHPKRKAEARKAMKRIKTLAGRLLRDIDRKLPEGRRESFLPQKEFFERVLAQKRTDSNKIYSLHEPQVACIAKGKAHKPYEFGSKIGFATLPGSNVIVGVAHFLGNPHDSQTLGQTLSNAHRHSGKEFKKAIVDRGYRGKSIIENTEIIIPNTKKDSTLSKYKKQIKRKHCQSRAAIEPIIGHMKHDHRMARNFLKGVIGDQINALMAAAGFNFKKALNQIKKWLNFLFNLFFNRDLIVNFKMSS